MNKELTPLEAYEKINHTCCLNASFSRKMEFGIDTYDNIDCESVEEMCQCLDTIETALKRLEEHDRIFKKYDIKDIWLEPALYVIKNHFPMNTETQLKKLKALEIIKEKQLDICQIMDIIGIPSKIAVEMYNKDKDIMFQITIEEFDLLKDVLKCKRRLKI